MNRRTLDVSQTSAIKVNRIVLVSNVFYLAIKETKEKGLDRKTPTT